MDVDLCARTPFVWNATNVTKQMRARTIGLCADYGARIEIIALETTPVALHRRNRARANPVPEPAIRRMINRWEAPDLTEAHSVTTLRTSS